MLWQEVTLGSIAQYRQLARPTPTYASNSLKAITSPLYTKYSTCYHCSEEATPLNWGSTVPQLWAISYLTTWWFEHKKGIDCWTPECVSILQPYLTFVQENIHVVAHNLDHRVEQRRGGGCNRCQMENNDLRLKFTLRHMDSTLRSSIMIPKYEISAIGNIWRRNLRILH